MKRSTRLMASLVLSAGIVASGCSAAPDRPGDQLSPLLSMWEADLAGRELHGPGVLGEHLSHVSDALRVRLGDSPVRYRYEVLDDGAGDDEGGPTMVVWADQRDDTGQAVASLPLRECGQLTVDASAGTLVWGQTTCPESVPDGAPGNALPDRIPLPSLADWPAPPTGIRSPGCAPEDLTAVIDGFSGAMGARSARLVLQNVSESACTLTSTPALQLTEDGESRVIALHGTSAGELTLSPLQMSVAWLGWRADSRHGSGWQRIDALLPGRESFEVSPGTATRPWMFDLESGTLLEVSPFSAPSDWLAGVDAGEPTEIVAPPCEAVHLDASMSITKPTIRHGYDQDVEYEERTSAVVELTNNGVLPCRVGSSAAIDAPGAAVRVYETSDADATMILPSGSARMTLGWDQGPTSPPPGPWHLSVPGANLDLRVEGDTAWGLVGAEVSMDGWR